MKKEIIIKLPKDAEDIQVYKELSLDNGDSILIKVRENTFGEDATEEQSEPKRTAVPVAEQYKEELEKHICIIKYDE